jgi:hypothetical protein
MMKWFSTSQNFCYIIERVAALYAALNNLLYFIHRHLPIERVIVQIFIYDSCDDEKLAPQDARAMIFDADGARLVVGIQVLPGPTIWAGVRAPTPSTALISSGVYNASRLRARQNNQDR